MGTAAAVIGIASAAWSSAKSLYHFVSSYSDAPKAVQDLVQDVANLAGQLEKLNTYLQSTNDNDLSDNQKPHYRSGTGTPGL